MDFIEICEMFSSAIDEYIEEYVEEHENEVNREFLIEEASIQMAHTVSRVLTNAANLQRERVKRHKELMCGLDRPKKPNSTNPKKSETK